MDNNEVSIQTKNYSVQILDIIRSNHTDEELKMLLEEYHENDIDIPLDDLWK